MARELIEIKGKFRNRELFEELITDKIADGVFNGADWEYLLDDTFKFQPLVDEFGMCRNWTWFLNGWQYTSITHDELKKYFVPVDWAESSE